jgi:hypothetical protein
MPAYPFALIHITTLTVQHLPQAVQLKRFPATAPL